MPETVDITELLEIDPTRVDAVGSPANGTEWLILKAIDGGDIVETEATLEDVLAELDKATEDKPTPCPLCKGAKKIKGGNVTCPKCKGTGIAPKVGQTEKELFDAAKEAGVAASGAPTILPDVCSTCKGNGKVIEKNGKVNDTDCPDCGGTGKDAHMATDDALHTVDGDAGSITVGAGGRETVDKAARSTADENDLPDSAFAYIEKGGEKDADGKTTPRTLRHFPIDDAAHVRNALARVSQSPFGKQAMPAIKAAAEKFGVEVAKDSGIISGPNPFLNGATNASTTDPNATDATDVGPAPGSPEWEATDADLATGAANAILQAYELTRQFRDREGIEVAAGEGNDVFDTFEAETIMDALSFALGQVATLAFHEGVAAQKSTHDLTVVKSALVATDKALDLVRSYDDDAVEKSGKRLSTKSVSALAAARDHLTSLLGDDDPAKSDDDDAKKSQEDIFNMDKDELSELVAETVAKAVEAVGVVKAANDVQDVDHSNSIAGAKNANAKAKKKNPKADNTALEDEANQGDNDSASSPAMGAAKAEKVERTPEEIEARKAVKAQKKELKKAERAEKQAAKKATLTKTIEESLAKVVEQNEILKSTVETLSGELEGVKKMAAPTAIVKTAPREATAKAVERDAKEIRIASLENEMRNTSDPAIRAGNREIIKELRAELTGDN